MPYAARPIDEIAAIFTNCHEFHVPKLELGYEEQNADRHEILVPKLRLGNLKSPRVMQ